MASADIESSTRLRKTLVDVHTVLKSFFDFYEVHSKMTSLGRTDDLYKKLGGRFVMPFDDFTAVIDGWLASGKGEPMYDVCRNAALSSARITAGMPDGSIFFPAFSASVMLLASDPFVERMRVIFFAFDMNGDGFLTAEELSECLKTFMEGTTRFVVDLVTNPTNYGMPAFDASAVEVVRSDLKRVLDVSNVPKLVETAFAAADLNKDSKLSMEEWVRWVSSGDFDKTWPGLAGLFHDA